jgi:hypothetical protein
MIGRTEYPGDMHILSWPFVPKKLRDTNRQDMVFIRPPGIADGAFQLRMGNIWFFKPLILFKISTKTYAGMLQHECAHVSVLEEYNGPRKAGHIVHIVHIMHIMCCTYFAYIDGGFHLSLDGRLSVLNNLRAQGTDTSVVRHSSQLNTGRPRVVPVGEKGTLPLNIRRESADVLGNSCDKSQNSGDGCRW